MLTDFLKTLILFVVLGISSYLCHQYQWETFPQAHVRQEMYSSFHIQFPIGVEVEEKGGNRQGGGRKELWEGMTACRAK